MEHYRLGTTSAILSRSFCDAFKMSDVVEIEKVFKENMADLRAYEDKVSRMTEYSENQEEVIRDVARIVEMKKGK